MVATTTDDDNSRQASPGDAPAGRDAILSEPHREYLRSHAIADAVIDASGAASTDAGIMFLYRGPAKRSYQLRPDSPGDGPKYRFAKGATNFLNIVRDDGTGPVLVVEGTKQTLAAASWAPAEYAIVGVSGCTMWHKHDWDFCESRDVLICFDGDAATNRDVYNQARKLGEELKYEGAKSVRFVQIPMGDASDKTGLDDYLAATDEPDRARALAKLIRRASLKPADTTPRPKQQQQQRSGGAQELNTGGRAVVAVNDDLNDVINGLVKALKDRWDGHSLFNYGRVITKLNVHKTAPLGEGEFLDVLAQTVMLVTRKAATEKLPERCLPGGRADAQAVKAVMSRAEDFAELRRVTRAPFVRPDGTICVEAGYDAATHTVLVPDPVLEGITVPDDPAEEDAKAAARFLTDEWLGDFPFPDAEARANAVAFVLTSFIRGLVPLVPMPVINGLEPGVGKGLLTDCVCLMATGQPAKPLQYIPNEDELRKQITASFAQGADFLVLDEAHRIESLALSRALTALTYTDRVLGVSRMAEFPNQAVWAAMGNQSLVLGDMSRRVYWVDLKPVGTTLADREGREYRHPDIRAWTAENRAALVTAALTLVRAWFAAGRPEGPRKKAMGSFEGWDQMMDGILNYAGIHGFLEKLSERRSESDFHQREWVDHLRWLRLTFSGNPFTTRDVRDAAMRSPGGYESPPGMEDASGKGYTRELGKAYSQKLGRRFESLSLVKDTMAHGNVAKWCVAESKEDHRGGSGGSIGSSQSSHSFENTLLCAGTCDGPCVCVSRIGGQVQQPIDPPHPPEGGPDRPKTPCNRCQKPQWNAYGHPSCGDCRDRYPADVPPGPPERGCDYCDATPYAVRGGSHRGNCARPRRDLPTPPEPPGCGHCGSVRAASGIHELSCTRPNRDPFSELNTPEGDPR